MLAGDRTIQFHLATYDIPNQRTLFSNSIVPKSAQLESAEDYSYYRNDSDDSGEYILWQIRNYTRNRMILSHPIGLRNVLNSEHLAAWETTKQSNISLLVTSSHLWKGNICQHRGRYQIDFATPAENLLCNSYQVD